MVKVRLNFDRKILSNFSCLKLLSSVYYVSCSYLNVMGDLIDFILNCSKKDALEAKMFKEKVEKDSGENVKGLYYDHLSPIKYDLESLLKVMEMGVQHCFFVTGQFLNDSLMDFLKDSSLHRSIELGENQVILIWTKYKGDFTTIPYGFAALAGLYISNPSMFKIVRMCATDELIEKMINIRQM